MSAGTLTVEPTINGTGIGLTAVLASGEVSDGATQAKDTDAFLAGDKVGCRVTTTGSFSPTSTDCACLVFVEM